MKYGTIWKSTLREIKGSFGRFAAIMAIVALGVGLFSGLKVTRAAMVEMVQSYWEDMNLYDYRLLSSYGFEREDVEFLRAAADVKAVEGALSFDVLYRDEKGTEGVVKIYSLTEHVNGVTVLEGRMPSGHGECLVDANLFGSEAIGKKLVLSENNDEDTLEHFSDTQYTIVGRARSSLYIQFERGNTSLGTGKIDGFVYLQPEGFEEEYYTELYVKFHEDMPLYSDEYKDFLQEKDVVWEDLTEQAAGNRFGRLRSDAEQEYADALEEFETEKADAEQELADAKRELTDAEEELADAEQKIADAEKELADARKEIADGEKELADARQTIADKEKELEDGERELADARKEWKEQDDKVEAAKRELEQKEEELSAQEALFLQEKEKLLAGEEQVNAALKELENNQELTAALVGAEIRTGPIKDMQDVYSTRTAIAGKLTALNYLLSMSEGDPVTSVMLNAQISALKGISDNLGTLVSNYEKMEAGKAELAAGEEQIQSGWEQIAAARQTLEGADRELTKALQEILDAEKEIEDGRTALEDARKELEDGERELADARKKVADGEKELADAKQEYEDGLAEYGDGLVEYEDGLAEFEEEIADAEAELADAREEIDSMELPDTYVLGRDTNIGYVCFESDSAIVDGIANVFPVFFFLVAALVCITTMNRMVEEQRTQIGVLKALGYGEAAVMMKYIFYSGSAALLGCVIGFAGGTYIFPKVIWFAYCMMYNVGEIGYVFDWKLAVISVLVSVLCSVGTTWLSCRMELSQVAAQLMRPKAPKAGKRVFLEYITFVWKRLSFLRKVSARNIFRYKKRLFMMVLGISGCTALLVTGFGINDSIAGVADQQFNEIQIYDLSLNLSDGLDFQMKETLEEIFGVGTQEPLVSDWIPLAERSMDIVTDSTRKSAYVVVMQDGADTSPFLDLHTLKDEPIDYPGPGEAVLSHKIAENLGIGIGDTLVLENDDLRRIEAVVTGINKNFIYNYVYLDESTFKDCMGEEPELKTLYVNVAPEADMHLLSAALMGTEGVVNVTVNEDVLVRFNRMMSSLNLIVVVVIICAAMLAFVVLYNLTNINITERIREIATIKVLGFYKNETASYVFRENTVLTLLGALPGLLLGKALHAFVMSQIKVDMVSFDVRILPQSYLYSLVFTFLFGWFVNLIMRGKLEKVSMTESLKSVD